MCNKDLKNKPLVEALLELKWLLSPQEGSDLRIDPHYRLLLGRFSERIQSDYPFHEPLPTSEIPDTMGAHMAQHRFRRSKGSWPLLQIGPGLMTVNATDDYTWPDFQRRCEGAVANLFDAHPCKSELKVTDLTLRYIDAVDVDFQNESVFQFLIDKMKTEIKLPESLFEGVNISNVPSAFNWQASFPHDIPGGFITLRFAMGQRGRNSALLWETLVQTNRDRIPEMPEGFGEWLSKAHDLTDDWFFKMIRGELQRRFSSD